MIHASFQTGYSWAYLRYLCKCSSWRKNWSTFSWYLRSQQLPSSKSDLIRQLSSICLIQEPCIFVSNTASRSSSETSYVWPRATRSQWEQTSHRTLNLNSTLSRSSRHLLIKQSRSSTVTWTWISRPRWTMSNLNSQASRKETPL